MSFLKAITPTIRKEISVKTPDGEQQFTVLWKRPNDDRRLELIASINARVEAMFQSTPDLINRENFSGV